MKNQEVDPKDARNENGDLNACSCGGALRFDPDRCGRTCGGVDVVGALVCEACGKAWLCRRSKEGSPPGHAWTLASSGVSLDAGGTRLRADGRKVGTARLMARISKLPVLEQENERLRRTMTRLATIAARCADGDLPFGLADELRAAWSTLGVDRAEAKRLERGCAKCHGVLDDPDHDLCERCSQKENAR